MEEAIYNMSRCTDRNRKKVIDIKERIKVAVSETKEGQ